ncbi:PIG-L deacetylase family protein [Streptomyces varsoviensis]|nr:PIG-L family deacetylase [Streptomyces varsoviensis]
MNAPHTRTRYADPLQAPGTEERLWRAWRGWTALPEARLPRGGRVVVAAAHPDDEVLGFGGAISLLAGAGSDLTVVAVTDGEGSHPAARAVTPAAMARRRAEERRAALRELGAPDAGIVRLGVPDTRVARHERAVARALAPLLPGAALLAAPWTGDVHSDHEATGRAARAAAARAGVRCLLYPVWLWHWARPGDPRVPWEEAARIDLPPEARGRKAAAVARFVSQTEPLGPAPEEAAILPPEEIAHHLRDVEVVFP